MTGLRFLRATGALIVSGLLLASCMQLNMGLTVNPDDTVDGQLLLTADKSILTSNGRTAKQGFEDLRKNIPDMPPGPEEVYEDAKRYGALIKYNHTPLDQFNSESVKLVKNNGTYRFTLPLDPKLYGNAPSATPQSRDAFMKAMEFEIQVTFPDLVLDSNGTEVGRTVTWQIKAGQEKPVQLFATAAIPATAASSPATTGGGGGFPWLLIIAGAVVLAIAAVVVFFLLRRSSASKAAAPAPEASVGTAPPPGAA